MVAATAAVARRNTVDMWIAATVAHYLAGDKPLFLLPIALIAVLTVSYVTRSSDRRVSAAAMLS